MTFTRATVTEETGVVDVPMLTSMFERTTKDTLRDNLSKLYSFSAHCSTASSRMNVSTPLEELAATQSAAKMVARTLEDTKTLIGIEAVVTLYKSHLGDDQYLKSIKHTLQEAGVTLPPPIKALLDKAMTQGKRALAREASVPSDAAAKRRKAP